MRLSLFKTAVGPASKTRNDFENARSFSGSGNRNELAVSNGRRHDEADRMASETQLKDSDSNERGLRYYFLRSEFALRKIESNIGSVSLPVNVFC